ncbi:MAG: 5'-methylthioadenosine/S-adenosylhomocysteine nucleosidase [Treponema sp.]|jgi:adenosylhomocysteine nucleosidase|nr:5'-methylthioadenosine/S-adenosylhomocysteine nucleosidase [Treponema sp.]
MIGIIGAMEDEVKTLREAMGETRTERTGGFEFYLGRLEGAGTALLRCGVGKVNAAVGCALLINRYKPSLIINTGSAGGIGPGLKFGDAVISTGLVYHDVDVTAFDHAPGQIPGQPQIFAVEESLVRLAEQAVDELKGEGVLPGDFHHVRGIIGSGDVFMHEPERIAEVRRRFPEIRAVEMEGAAIAHTCVLFTVPAIIIRALSDIAGLESPVTSDVYLPLASKHSAAIVRRIVRNHRAA